MALSLWARTWIGRTAIRDGNRSGMRISSTCLRSRPTSQPRPSQPLCSPTGSQTRSSSSKPNRSAVPSSPADSPDFISIADQPAVLVRAGHHRRHSIPGLLFLALIPLTAFGLGTWQIKRLYWKQGLISRAQDRLVRPPVKIDRDDLVRLAGLGDDQRDEMVEGLSFRRVVLRGKFRHDREMVVGPRLLDGQDGYLVITPFEPELTDGASTEGAPALLVNRGWIPKSLRSQQSRREADSKSKSKPTGSEPVPGLVAFPDQIVEIEGLLRPEWQRNFFSPPSFDGAKANVDSSAAAQQAAGQWVFPDVTAMAKAAGKDTIPVWVEQTVRTVDDTLLKQYDKISRGVPVSKVAGVEMRDNHLQYIVTWYALGLATSVMFWMLVKKPPRGPGRGVRRSVEW